MGQLIVSSLVSAQTGEPKIDLVDPEKEWRAQLSVGEARVLAINILQATEAGLADGFLHGWVTRMLEATPSQAAQILNEFRVYRSEREAWPKVVVIDGTDG